MIIYLKKDDNFYKIKKQKENNFKSSNKEDILNYKNLEKKYRELKLKYEKNRKSLIQEIRGTLANENIPYKYFLG